MHDPRLHRSVHRRVARWGALVMVSCLPQMHAAWAQEVGTIAAVDGQGEIGRGSTWTGATVGAAIQRGDELRTGRPGRLSIVFQDDTVLTLTEDSHVTVNEQVFDPNQGTARSLMGLLRGKVNAVVGEYYHRPNAVYEVQTPTAVAGVRGTEFTISYDSDSDLTEVVGISGRVEVHSLVDPTGPGVLVTAHEVTTVLRTQLPTAPRRLDDTIFRQQLEGINFIGGGRAEGLTSDHPLQAGTNVPPPDRANAAVAPAAAPSQGSPSGDASNLVGDSPLIIRAMKGQLGISF